MLIPGTGFVQAFTVVPGIVTKVTLPSADASIVGSEIIQSRAIRVIADKDVVVYASTFHQYRSEASLVLPTGSLGSEYRIMSYESQNNGGLQESEFIIVSVGETITVEITTTAPTALGQVPGVPWTVTLDSGEVYQVQAAALNDNLTGSLIRSVSPTQGAPFAVYSGHVWVWTYCFGNKDPLYEANYPVNTWGLEYVILPTPHRVYDEYRVLSATDDLIIYKNGVVLDTLDTGEFLVDTISSPTVISATCPFSAAQFIVTGACDGFNSDPSMTILNSNEQMFLDSITFYTVDKFNIDSSFVSIVTRTPDAESIYLNGVLLTGFTPIAADPNLSYKTLRVDTGSHTLNTSGEGFLAYVLGMGFAESYAYAAGVLLKDLTDISFTNITTGLSIICVTDSLQFISVATGEPFSYYWDFGDSITSTLKDPVHAYDSLGDYLVTLILEYSCRTDTLKDTLKVILKPVVELGQDTLFCFGNVLVLDAGNPVNNYYTWNTGDTTQTIPVTVSGTYFVFVDNLSCSVSDTIEIIVTQDLSVDAGPDEDILKCTDVILTADASDEVTYAWEPTTGLHQPSSPTTVASPLQTITYHVTATDSDGCIATDSITIEVRRGKALAVPSAFTPNGDNINDVLGLVSICIETVDFFIMNRFGNKVFATNDPFKTWDGTYKGTPVPMDTYTYFVKGTTYKGEVLTDKGTITLIR